MIYHITTSHIISYCSNLYQNDLDKHRKQIQELQKKQQIVVDLGYWSSDFNSIDNKMSMLRMINRMDTDNNVESVYIELNSSHKYNDEIL